MFFFIRSSLEKSELIANQRKQRMDENDFDENVDNEPVDESCGATTEHHMPNGVNPETLNLKREIKSIERQVAEMSRRMKLLREQFAKIKEEDKLTEKRLAEVKAQDVL